VANDAKYNISLQWIFASQLLEKGNDIQWLFGMMMMMMMIYLKDKSRKYPIFFLTLLYSTVKITCELSLSSICCHPYPEGFVPSQQLLLN